MARMLPVPPQKTLREYLDYDPDTGILRWKKKASSTAMPGQIAGSRRPDGYLNIGIAGKRYLYHRIVWMHVRGGDPKIEVDHRNRVRDDNRVSNLRPSGQKGNSGNTALPSHNTSGQKGVCWDKSRSLWIVHIKINGRQKFLGRYVSIDDASRAYDRAAEAHFGQFALTNRAMAA